MTDVIAITGATAAGKSTAALALAERYGGEIVNADAMQVYAGLPILTNQPSAADRARVPHHVLAAWPLTAEGDVARYAALAHAAIDGVIARGKVAVVVGGTGLYLRAALADLQLPPQSAPEQRARLVAAYDADPAATYERLRAVDVEAANRIHPNDRRRVVRALELHELGSSLAPAGADALWNGSYRRSTRVHAVRVARDELHRRIAARAEAMFAAGVVEEVRTALAAGEPSTTAARALGLDEVRGVIEGRLTEAAACQRLIERTRQYARRQEIWIRRLPDVEPFR